MRKLLLFILISLLLIPSLASAFWYTNIEVEKNISESLIAGSTDSVAISFKNNLPLMTSLIARLNVTSKEVSIEEDDFIVEATLNSISLYPAYPESASSKVNVNCIQKEAGIFYCFNLTDVVIRRCLEFFKRGICFTKGRNFVGSYIVLPKSENDLTFYITFNPALIPANYSFKVDLFSDFGVPRIIDPIEAPVEKDNPTLFNASIADTSLWITGNENKSLSVDVILYEFVLQEELVPKDLIPIKFVGIETNDNENIAFVEIRIYYNESELPEWTDESSLRLYFYNNTDPNPENWKWEKVEDSGVNEEENYVWGKLDHLSLFGILGLPIKTAESSPSGGGGGSSGGGNGGAGGRGRTIVKKEVTPCIENWVCTDWSECSVGNIQIRKCTDLNNCGTLFYKPAETKTCVYTLREGIEEKETTLTPPTGLLGITGGAVTGFLKEKPVAMSIIVLVVVVIFGFYWFVFRKNEKKLNKS